MADLENGTTVDPTETDYAALSELSLETDSPEPAEPASVETPPVVTEQAAPAPAPVVPVSKPEVAPVPVTPPAPAPVPAPEAPQQPAAAPQPTPAPTAGLSPEQFTERRNTLLTEIQGRYAVSDAEAERYVTEPHKVLPELAAKVMLDAFDASVAVVTSLLPQVIEDLMSRRTVVQDAQKAFFTQWPQLEKPEYAPHIQKATALYRQMNPKAPLKQALSDIGVMVAVSLGIPVTPPSPAAQPAPAMRPVPFNPGGPGVMAPPSPQLSENEFTKLALLADED